MIALWTGLLTGLSLGASACGGGAESVDGARSAGASAEAPGPGTKLALTDDLDLLLEELEGLAFVPSGRTFIGSALDVGSTVDLLVDRYEVWNARWRRWTPGTNPIPAAYRPRQQKKDPRPGPEAWVDQVPAVGMTLSEARAFAERRSMRLPTFEEWLWCAVGPTCRFVPAGRRQKGFANTLETELHRATPVGAFESGQTPVTGIYDMLGNVWEWIEPPPERLRSDWDVLNDLAWPEDSALHAPTWVLGGSFMTPDRRLYNRDSLMALATTLTHRSNEVGFRCCVDGDIYLGALPRDSRPGPARKRRLEAVGRRWGASATGLLDELLELQPGHPWLEPLRDGARNGGTGK